MDQNSHNKSAFINHWKMIDPVLRKQAKLELQNLTHLQRQRQIANLLDLAVQFRKPRMDRGLMILQRSFAGMFDNEPNS